MKTLAFAVATLIAPGFAAAESATADDWVGARPAVTLSVAPAAAAGMYEVTAEIKDLRSGTILSAPRLTILAGKTGSIHVGSDDGAMVKVSVAVDPAAQHVTYSTELLEGSVVQASHSASIALK